MSSSAVDFYSLLGVPQDADDHAVREAWRQARDRLNAAQAAAPDDPALAEQRATLHQALGVLGDANRRAAYDEILRRRSEAAAAELVHADASPWPEAEAVPPEPEPETTIVLSADAYRALAEPEPSAEVPPTAPPIVPSSTGKPPPIWLAVSGGLLVLLLAGVFASVKLSPKPSTGAAAAAPAAPTDAAFSIPTDAKAVASDKMIEWEEAAGGAPSLFTADGLLVQLAARAGKDGREPTLTVTGPDGKPFTVTGQVGFDKAAAAFGVGRLDPTSALSQVVFTSYSGGAHCCTEVKVLDYRDGRWRALDLGQWDGEGPDFPTDLNGDGGREFSMADNAFLYAFESYAGSWAPPKILRLEAGQIRDVSADAAYRDLFRKDAARAETECLKHRNGPCAGYVASSIRAGRFEAAWAVMLQNYDQASDWRPQACRSKASGECPTADVVTFASFPEALRWFLGEEGYLSPSPLPPRSRAFATSFDCARAASANLKLICATEDLAASDRRLADLFAQALRASADPERLKADERDFVSRQTSGPGDVESLRALYRDRIDQLEGELAR